MLCKGLLQSAVVEVGKRVRHGFRTGKDLLEERPFEDEEISTLTCHGLNLGKSSAIGFNASLITDFQLITDIRVSLILTVIRVYVK